MTKEEFNKKWEWALEEGHYGMDINDEDVINFMDGEFEWESEKSPTFFYSQIKTKFGFARVYTTSEHNDFWEERINEILKRNTT